MRGGWRTDSDRIEVKRKSESRRKSKVERGGEGKGRQEGWAGLLWGKGGRERQTDRLPVQGTNRSFPRPAVRQRCRGTNRDST